MEGSTDLARADSQPVVDPRAALAAWLRTGRARRRMSVDDVARVTKIQPRFLEKLEAGQIRVPGDGMPAEVFVRGFVRSFARCVGLDEAEALDRYTAIERGANDLPVARALVETMLWEPPAVEPEPAVAPAPPIEPVPTPVAVAAEPPKKKRAPRKKAAGTGAPRTRKKKSTTPPAEASVEIAAQVDDAAAALPVEVASTMVAPVAPVDAEPAPIEPAIEPETPARGSAPEIAVAAETWKPTMPPPATTPTVPWRRPAFVPPPLPNLPSLVIDDADPDRAERIQAARAKEHRRTFLPPILLERDDRTGSQRGLTLAVIILLVAATLTLSYLMRRPTPSGDGVTMSSSAGEHVA